MRIVIVSDIHDNVWNLRAALDCVRDADALLCCGDLCSPFVVGLMAEGFPAGRIELVCGNNDGDLMRITQNAARYAGRVRLRGEFAELPAAEYDGLRIAMIHYPDVAHRLAASGDYDLVCYGHDHRFAIARHAASGALTINPGTLMGYDPIGGADTPATFVVIDTATRHPEAYELDPGGAAIPRVRMRRT